MDENPYQATLVSNGAERSGRRLSILGCMLSASGFVGLFVGHIPLVGYLTLAACVTGLLGFVVSLLALLYPSRRVAAWGATLGFIVMLYVPHILYTRLMLGR